MYTVTTSESCLLCKNGVEITKTDIVDTRFGILDSFLIGRCSNCRLMQSIPRLAPQQLKKLYETYYNFYQADTESYIEFRKIFLRSRLFSIWLNIDGDISFYGMKGSGRLLDVGCNEGRGLFIYKKNGFSSEGLETNLNAARIAEKNGHHVHTIELDDFTPKDKFDVVVLSNVLEHFQNPKMKLLRIREILNPLGEIWISCPNYDSWMRMLFGRFWINWHVPFHIVHFSQKTLVSLLRDAGFEDIRVKIETPALWVAQSLIAAIFSKYGKPTLQLRSPILVGGFMLLIRGLFFPILWLANRFERGDCLVVRARCG